MSHRILICGLGFAPLLLMASLPAHAQTYTAGAGLTLTGNQFSIANGGVTGAMIGLPLALSASSSSPILTVTNTGSGYGIKTVSTSGTGTYGTNTKYGNVGTLGDINGFGVYGSTAAGPYPYGVYGINRSSGNGDYGILGGVDPVNKAPVGVLGSDTSSGTSGYGVYGLSANSFGVYGSSAGGVGTYGTNTKYGNHGTLGDVNGFGVYGSTAAGPYPYGVYGINRASGNGDYGLLGGAEPITGNKYPVGVFGNDTSSFGYGVYGNSANGYGLFANSNGPAGIVGYSSSSGSDGSGSGDGILGVSGSGSGVYGGSNSGRGVYGVNYGNSDYGLLGGKDPVFNDAAGAVGVDTVENGDGVFGSSSGTNGFGVAGYATGPSGVGVFGRFATTNGSTGHAGEFIGDVSVSGTLTAGAKNFKIDHPLDPTNKYLYHASVESDKMEDIYNGHVTTDAQGNATVTMPSWFQALNTDFDYQLTVVGQFAQAIIGQEIQGNQFTIKTDKPKVKVCWLVTGVRHDAFALAHPLQVEQDKPEKEQGFYQNPDAFGQPDSMGIDYAQRHRGSGKP